MEIVNAEIEDFDTAYSFICALWDYNTYDKETIRNVYKEVLNDQKTFAFFVKDKDEYIGFCQGDYFNTFWMSGLTTYVSGIITRADMRGRGIGTLMMDHVKELSNAVGSKAIILDSGLPRKAAHSFYENYGFEKSCYGFELAI
jgi:GNAT superfamily N-acetyltransferase